MSKLLEKNALAKLVINGLFHSTTLRNLKLILDTGSIQPNLGQFPPRHVLSHLSACRRHGGISLFDLSVDKHGSFFGTWLREVSQVTIKLDRRVV